MNIVRQSTNITQASVLGPLLFLIIRFFADDTSLFSIVNDPTMQSFNPDPAKQAVQVVFSRKCKQIDHPKIYFNDI